MPESCFEDLLCVLVFSHTLMSVQYMLLSHIEMNKRKAGKRECQGGMSGIEGGVRCGEI